MWKLINLIVTYPGFSRVEIISMKISTRYDDRDTDKEDWVIVFKKCEN